MRAALAALSLAALLAASRPAAAQVFWDAADFQEHCSALQRVVAGGSIAATDQREATTCIAFVMGAADMLVAASEVYGGLTGQSLRLFCPTGDSTPDRLSRTTLDYMASHAAAANAMPAAESVIIALVEAFPCPH